MEEDRLSIIQNLLSIYRKEGEVVSIRIYSDFSGHLEDSNYKRIKHSEFYNPEELLIKLSYEYMRRKENKEYVGNVITRFMKRIKV